MYKIKLFSKTTLEDLELAVNTWLSSNPIGDNCLFGEVMFTPEKGFIFDIEYEPLTGKELRNWNIEHANIDDRLS